MAIYDTISDVAYHPIPARTGFFRAIARAFQTVGKDFADYRELVRISRMSPRMIRDMGFDPAEIYAAVEPDWGDVHNMRWRSLER